MHIIPFHQIKYNIVYTRCDICVSDVCLDMGNFIIIIYVKITIENLIKTIEIRIKLRRHVSDSIIRLETANSVAICPTFEKFAHPTATATTRQQRQKFIQVQYKFSRYRITSRMQKHFKMPLHRCDITYVKSLKFLVSHQTLSPSFFHPFDNRHKPAGILRHKIKIMRLWLCIQHQPNQS